MAVLAGGCSGFQYKFQLDEAVQPDDFVVQSGAARVVVDPASLELLAGAQLDYTDELMGSHFTVRNPQRDQRLRLRHQLLGRLMSGEPITLEFIGRNVAAMQVELRGEMRAIRDEVGDIRRLILLTVDKLNRTDRHSIELKDELELMIKAEAMGRIDIFEGGVEKRIGELTERVEELETGKSRFTP